MTGHDNVPRRRFWFPPLVIAVPPHEPAPTPIPKFTMELELSEWITVITTTNPIPSIPETRMIRDTQRSLFRIGAFRSCKKLVVFDGIPPHFATRTTDYEEYKRNVAGWLVGEPFCENTELLFCDSWVGLSGSIRKALGRVETPFVYIHQHDLLLVRDFDLRGIIATMIMNDNIKHVRLNCGPINRMFDWHLDKVIEGPHYVPVVRENA